MRGSVAFGLGFVVGESSVMRFGSVSLAPFGITVLHFYLLPLPFLHLDCVCAMRSLATCR